jgi:hypothetical protein
MLELSQLKSMAERATDLTSDAREASERDRDYYDSFQYTAEEEAVLRKRKQPIVTINRIKRKVDAMVGIEQRGRVDPVAQPRNPQDEEAADLATKALRFVEETQRIDVKRSAAFENLIVEGYGGVEVIAEEYNGQMDVCIKRLRWEEIFFDPHSREKDFSDAAYLGVLKWMSLDAAMEYASAFWQGDRDELESILDTGADGVAGETYEDRPQREGGMAWADKRLKRVRVAQMYYKREGQWHLAIFTGKGELFNDVSPYVENGKPCCPIILMSGYVDRENRRYGVVRDMISIQDEINKRRSKLLNALNNRQTMGTKGAVNVAEMKRQLSMPDGHVEVDPAAFDPETGMKPFDIIPTTDMTSGQFALLQEAKAEIDMLGPNASLLGQLQGSQSGRAIMAQQQAGLAELAPIYDSLRDWTERVYRACWHRIKQFWREPRWIRVTDDEASAQFVAINQMQMTPYGMQMMNAVAEIDVDIIVDQAPDYASLRAEQFDKLADLAAKGVPIPPDVLIDVADIRDKRKLMEKLQPPPEAQAQQAQMAQAQMQMAERGAMAEIDKTEAEAERARAAAAKDMASIGKMQFDAATQALRPMNTAAGF